jgi:3-isopropylmalate dehydrogenase
MNILLLPGDGIGPEVCAQAVRILHALAPDAHVQTGLVGGASLDTHGMPLTDATLAQAKAADAILFGAAGGPKWASQPFGNRPEHGLLRLRKELGLFANLRPARTFDALVDASSLKPDLVRGLDILFVRELTGGVYFGEPRGIETLPDGSRRGVNTQVYTTAEIHRIAHVAFGLARARRGVVCSVDKSNVMESGLLWRQEVIALHAAHYRDVTLTHMLADACAMELVRAPLQFDIILTDNLFGDLLSDEAAMLTGSLGLLPSAALGAPGAPGLYEPIHGSAPDIAGHGVANPLGMVLSLAMALRHSLDRADLAARVEAAVARTLEDGARTRDLGGTLGTAAMGNAVLTRL